MRLSKLALEVSALYLTEPVGVKPLYHGMNDVFRIVGTQTGSKYSLRVHPPNWLSQQQVEAEMCWLDTMNTVGLPVPGPVRRLDNAGFVTLIDQPEIGVRCCTFCRWIEGRTLSERLSLKNLRAAGEILARIHEQGHTFAAIYPGIFNRPRLDCDGIFGAGGIFDPSPHLSKLTREHMTIIEPSMRKVRDAMKALDDLDDSFGPIHGDFYYKNLLVSRNSLNVIDFDMSGWGYYCFDLAVPHWPNSVWKRGDEFSDALLAGYRSIREFPKVHERYIPMMLACRRLMDIYCVLSRWDDPKMRSNFNESIDWACHILYKWLQTGEIV